MIKVPATPAGVPAVEELTARGVNVNVTLLFSVERYEEVIEAYLRGLERRVAAGLPVDGIASVASFFVSRVDAKADALLPPTRPPRTGGDRQRPPRLRPLPRALRRRRGGAHSARRRAAPAAAVGEHGHEGPGYSDVLYVERLIAPGVINTMPRGDPARLRRPRRRRPTRRTATGTGPTTSCAAPPTEGVDLAAITAELEREGVRSFCDSYHELLALHRNQAPRGARLNRCLTPRRGASRRGCRLPRRWCERRRAGGVRERLDAPAARPG